MERLDYKALAQLCREGDKYAIDLLTSHYYELIGKKYIAANPNKKNNKECAWKLCRLTVIAYSQTQREKYRYSSYINKIFRLKYKNYNMEDDFHQVKNEKMEYTDQELINLLENAKTNQEAFEKLYDRYYFLVEKAISKYDKDNLDILSINKLYTDILKKYLFTDKKFYITLYIKRYLEKNIKEDKVTFDLTRTVSKTPVLYLIEQAKENSEKRNELIEKYLYLVDKEAEKYPEEYQEELKSDGYYKLVQLIDTYLTGSIEMHLATYLSNSIKNTIERRIEQIKSERVREIEPRDSYQDMEIRTEEYLLVQEYLENAGLNERERDIIKKAEYEQKTYREIAEEYGITFNRVGAIHTRAIIKLKYYAQNEKAVPGRNRRRVGIYGR